MPARRDKGCDRRILPHWVRTKPGEDICDVYERRYEEYFLYALVLSVNNNDPDDGSADRNGVDARQAKQFEAGSDADEFGDHVAKVHDEDSEHHEKRDAQ